MTHENTHAITHAKLDDIVTTFSHSSGLTAVVAVVSTVLGPALTPLGLQNLSFEQADAVARKKGQALAEKCALHSIDNGGGCLIVLGTPETKNSAAFYELVAHICDHYNGQIIVGQDVGIANTDIERIHGLVKNPATVAYHPGRADHSATTAEGVRLGIQTAFNYACADKRAHEARILVQGLGNVGQPLVNELITHVTSHVYYADRTQKPGFNDDHFVPSDDAYDFDADVLSPCVSAAGLITTGVIERLNVKVIAGSSNLQFADEKALWAAHNKGILHAPDPIINGGGIIAVTQHTPEDVQAKLNLIPKTLVEIFERSRHENRPPLLIAQDIARERIAAGPRPR